MAATHYRHTQVGWTTVGALGAGMVILGLILLRMRVEPSGPLAVGLLVLLAALTLFATLRVEVDQEHLRVAFGIGLIRKRVRLADVRQFRTVRNPWYYGWGIHVTPDGVLYNVSGPWAVRVQMKDGTRFRVGTDEPEALCQALARVVGTPAPLSPAEIEGAKRSGRKTTVLLAGVLAAVLVFVGATFYLHEQPPKVTLTADTFSVSSVFYSQQFALRDITGVSLEQRLPRILLRTNGYAAGGTLRGHFRVDVLGKGQLFVERGYPPYVLVRRGAEFVIVNFEEPARTRELFGRLERALANQRTAPAE